MMEGNIPFANIENIYCFGREFSSLMHIEKELSVGSLM